MRLLIVEDEKRLALSLARGLTAEGYAVDVVHDGREGLDRATTEPYDLVILDIMLPGLNGFDVLKAVRADRRLADLPVIVLTAKGQANDRKNAEAIGASAFITKPFSNLDVVERVRELAHMR